MATSVNQSAAELKKKAMEKVENMATDVQEINDMANKANQQMSSEAEKSGLAHQLELLFCTLTLHEMAGKPSIITIKSKNIPPQANVMCTEGKNGHINTNITSSMTTHDGDELSQEQIDANVVINKLGGSIGRAVEAYVNSVLDKTRTWSQLYACAIEQKNTAIKKDYESWAKRNGMAK